MRCTTVYDLVFDSRNVGRAKCDESSVLNSKFKIENQEKTTTTKTDWVSITRDGPMICICRYILTRARQSLTSTSLSKMPCGVCECLCLHSPHIVSSASGSERNNRFENERKYLRKTNCK